jgi:lipopolysaccharide export system permease protein
LRKLNRYLIVNLIKILVLCQMAGMVIFLTIEFFDHVEVFTETFAKFGLSIAYMALKVPFYFNLILPLALLISILILIIVMIRGNEIIAIRTAGISTLSLMKPFIALSLGLVVFSFVLSEWVIPVTASASEYIYRIRIKKEQPYVVFKNDKIWFKHGNMVCNIDFFDTKRDVIKNLTVLELSDTYGIRKRTEAKEGRWEKGDWTFTGVTERTFGREGIIARRYYPTMRGLISEPPTVFKIVEKNPEEMSYGELQRYIQRLKKNGHDVRRYMVDLYNKIAFPFINVIMVLAAFSVGLRYAKTKHVSKGVFTGISVGVLYWFFHSVSLSFGYSDIFPPLFAAWLANLLFFSAGVIGIVTLRT